MNETLPLLEFLIGIFYHDTCLTICKNICKEINRGAPPALFVCIFMMYDLKIYSQSVGNANSLALTTKLDWQLHHYNYQWWEYADDKIPPWPLMTNSPHGGILSWWGFAG